MGELINLAFHRHQKILREMEGVEHIVRDADGCKGYDRWEPVIKVDDVFEKAEAKYKAHKERLKKDREKHNKDVTHSYQLKKPTREEDNYE